MIASSKAGLVAFLALLVENEKDFDNDNDNHQFDGVIDGIKKTQAAVVGVLVEVLNVKLPVKLVDGLTEEEAKLAREYSKKISVIKLVRDRSGIGLKEAKDYVEAWMERNGVKRPDDYPAPPLVPRYDSFGRPY